MHSGGGAVYTLLLESYLGSDMGLPTSQLHDLGWDLLISKKPISGPTSNLQQG